MSTLRTVTEIGIGLLYAVGAAFHVVYTMSHREEFFGSFADGSWFSPARWLINNAVIPNTILITIVLILFQGAIAVMILTRGDLVVPALIAGAVFSAIAALASSPGGTIGNLALAAIQVALATYR
jgi:hypothetical protein